MNLEIGQTLGHYEILGALGAGGMGEVYRARDTKLKREVAVKILPAHVANNPDSMSRFEREALALAQLSHPNILAIHDFGRYGGQTLAVTELLEGESLRSRLNRGPIPARKALEIAAAVADGLNAAHSKGIIHRDLKPENLFLTSDDQVKILDFGLAHIELFRDDSPAKQSKSSFPTQTDPGSIKGTVGYMSPEQLRGQEVDGRSDVFSLGCVLYEMLTGRRAFIRDTVADTMKAILSEEVEDFFVSGRQIPPDAERVTAHCLEKAPDKRFQSARDLSLHLKTLVSSPEISSPFWRLGPSSRTPLLWVLSAALLLIVSLAVFIAMHFRASSPAPSGKPSVAVLYFDNNTGDPSLDWLRSALPSMLITDLSQSPQIEVLSSDRLYQILKDLGQEDAQTTSFEVVEQLARRAGINTVILGDFVKAGETFRLNTRLQDATTGRILSTERVEGGGESSLFEMIDEVTRRVKTTLELSLAEDEYLDRGIEEVTSSSVEAYKHYVAGNSLHIQSREREALAPLEKAVALDPGFAMALAKLSVVHWNLGHEKESHDYAQAALNHVDRLTARERYYIEGRYYSLRPATIDKAVSAYEQAVQIYPDHTAARHNLANLYLEMERYDEALSSYEELVIRGSTFGGTYTNLAGCYALVGQYTKGYELLKKFSEDNPKQGVAFRDLGLYLLSWGKLQDAATELARAKSMLAEDLEVERGLIAAAILQEDWDTATRISNRLTDAEDSLARLTGLTALSVLAAYRGRFSEAFSALNRGLDLMPEPGPHRAATLVSLGNYYLEQDQPQKALEQAAQGRIAGRGYRIENEALLLEGLAYSSLNQPEKSRASFERIRSQFRAYPQLIVERNQDFREGWATFLAGDPEAAIALLKRADARANDSIFGGGERLRTWYLLGRAHWENGEAESAIPWLTRVIESGHDRTFDPIPYVKSFYYLGKAHEALGDSEKSRSYLRRFLAYWGAGEMNRNLIRDADAGSGF